MTIRYECHKCGSVLKIKEDRAGQKGKCPKCRTPFIIPLPSSSADSEATEDDLVAAYLSEEANTESESRPQRAVVADEVRKPKPRPARGQLSKAGGSASGIAGDLLASTGKKSRDSEVMDSEPTDVEAAKLAFRDLLDQYGKQVGFILAGTLILIFSINWLFSSAFTSKRVLPDLARVSGVVTVDGDPLVGGMVSFVPMQSKGASGVIASASYARTDSDGEYRVQYTKDVDGAVVGKHRVEIRATHTNGMQYLPMIYNEVTQLTFDVEPGGSRSADFELRTK